jgi:hypothetical protein
MKIRDDGPFYGLKQGRIHDLWLGGREYARDLGTA